MCLLVCFCFCVLNDIGKRLVCSSDDDDEGNNDDDESIDYVCMYVCFCVHNHTHIHTQLVLAFRSFDLRYSFCDLLL